MPVTDSTKPDDLLDPDFTAKLDRLELVSRKIFAGKMRGERRSKRRGESVEFADYRSYVSGDDLRFLDWNVYARLDSLFLKLFLQEEDLLVTVLVDTSKSMDWGEPNKGLYAKRIAAAIAYIGLSNFDRVSLFTYGHGLRDALPGLRGRRLMFKAIEFLTRAPYGGPSDFTTAAKQFAIRQPQRGIVLVLSDFFEKGGYEQGLRYLIGRHYDLYTIQILSPAEVDPTLVGDLELTDIEDGDTAEVTIGRALINRYKQNLKAYCQGLRDFCTKRGVNYFFTTTEVPFDQVVLSYFRKRGLIR
ncbi:MAG: DUF58 domain-containing protein [Phycisphaerae bacterium]